MGLNHILDELLIGAARYGLVWLGGFFAIAVGLGALSLWVWRHLSEENEKPEHSLIFLVLAGATIGATIVGAVPYFQARVQCEELFNQASSFPSPNSAHNDYYAKGCALILDRQLQSPH